jgi:Bacterial TSP3 repeat
MVTIGQSATHKLILYIRDFQAAMNTTPIRLLAATFCTALLFACGGGGGSSNPPVDQTPPTLTAQGATRAVVRKGDTAPLPASFAVTVGGNASTGTVSWKEGAATLPGSSGNTLPLNTAATALVAGEHTLTASITNPVNGKSAEATFSLLVLAENEDPDNDNDGLTYSQERAAATNTDPANGDTDGDGLADGAEAGLGTDPTKADSDSNGTPDGVQLAGAGGASLPPRSLMAAETGKSPGVSIGADGLSITFGDELNAACVNKTGPFNDPIYRGPPTGSATDALERCRKRAARANVGVRPGEFRYFETRRFGGLGDDSLQNIGQGIITPSAQIDPYCCYIDPGDDDYLTYVSAPPRTPTAANITPPSMTVNSIGGVFVRLVQVDTAFSPGLDIDLSKTDFYGFAVDYRGANPLVYVVARDRNNALVVSRSLDPGAFGGAPAMPMLHGHPVAGAGPHAAINLGFQKFHYSLIEVRAAITARGGDAAAMAGGVGIHRW